MPVEHLERSDLPSDAHDVGYRPSTANNWIDTDPVSVGEGLDDLADALSVLGFFNGTFLETFDALLTSDGAKITMTLTNAVSGNLTMIFSDGKATLDLSGSNGVIDTDGILVAGSDTSPQDNFVYILQSAKVLAVSTSDWPTAEHIKIGYFFIPSATFVQANSGAYVNQNWNDHAKDTATSLGHLSHMAERMRSQSAIYKTGADLTVTIAGGGSTVDFALSAGVIYQMHKQATAVADTSAGDPALVVNQSGTPFDDVTDLETLTNDANGVAFQKYFNWVVWSTANKTGEFSGLLINLPGGSYNQLASAIADTSGFDVLTMPAAFNTKSSTGFLIARLTFQLSAGVWTLENTVDLRGSTPQSVAGGGIGGDQTEFADNLFKLFDNADATKILQFQLDQITTANTRTITMADQDIDLTPNFGTFPTALHAARHKIFGIDALSHNDLPNLATGDVHTHYALLAGRSGGQTLKGGTGSGDDLTLESTSHATKGQINLLDVTVITGIADGGLTNYDLKVGDTTTPDYGMIQIGNAAIGRTSYTVGAIDLDGTILFRNIGGPVTSEIEFIFTESTGNTCRFALPKSGVGNATYNPRSMLIAGPAPADTDFVKVSYWQGQGIFDNLVCDTAGDGADFGVQNDLEVEGDIFVDSIKESTAAAGVTFDNNIIIQDAGTVKANLDIMQIVNTVNAADMYDAGPPIVSTDTSILFRQAADGGTVYDMARLQFGTGDDWTNTAASRDTIFRLAMVHDGVMADKLVATSGDAGFGFDVTGLISCYRDGANAQIGVFCHSATASHNCRVTLRKSRGTKAEQTGVVVGDRIGQFEYRGHDGTTMQNRASVFVEVDGAVDDPTNAVPMEMQFRTGTTSSTSQRFVIDSSGDILIATNAARLQFSSSTEYISGSGLMNYNTNAGVGHRFNVSAAIVAEIDTGEIRLFLSGTERGSLRWDANEVHLYQGTSQQVLRMGSATSSFLGRLRIGSGSAPATSAVLELSLTTGALLLSRLTTAERNALTAVNGMALYNSTTNEFNFYENGAWVSGSGLA